MPISKCCRHRSVVPEIEQLAPHVAEHDRGVRLGRLQMTERGEQSLALVPERADLGVHLLARHQR